MKDRDTGFSSSQLCVVYFCCTHTSTQARTQFFIWNRWFSTAKRMFVAFIRHGRQPPCRCINSYHRIVRIVLDFHAMPMQNCIRTLLTELTRTHIARSQIRTCVQFILFLHVANQLHNIHRRIWQNGWSSRTSPRSQSSEQLTRIMRDNRIKTGNWVQVSENRIEEGAGGVCDEKKNWNWIYELHSCYKSLERCYHVKYID